MLDMLISDLRTYQYPAGGCLSRDEFACPVLGFRHPSNLSVSRPVVSIPPSGVRIARHGGDRLLTEQPRQYSPGQDEQ